jgi:GT2 family glycosyltransferase
MSVEYEGNSCCLQLTILFCFHNRASKTLNMCSSLKSSLDTVGISYSIYCCDDGSSDESSENVRMIFPEANIILGNGAFFWNRGMIAAFESSLKKNKDLDILCVNDDCIFDSQKMKTFFDIVAKHRKSIIGAQFLSNGRVSYGGGLFEQSIFKPSFQKNNIEISHVAEVDWLNFNCVYVPRIIIEKLGFLDPFYHHSFGDIDYSFGARRAGYKILLAPPVGDCPENSINGTWQDASLTLFARYSMLERIKGLPFNERKHFAMKNFPRLFSVLWLIKPYVYILISRAKHLIIEILIKKNFFF